MAKKTMLDYIDERASNLFDEEEVQLIWDKRNFVIEVVFTLFAENGNALEVTDVEGVVSAEEVIEFEDSIAFYCPEKSTVNEDNYLALIPFDKKKGVARSIIDAMFAYLEQIIDEGDAKLADFLKDEAADEFTLRWDSEQFDGYLEQMTDDTLLPYPNY